MSLRIIYVLFNSLRSRMHLFCEDIWQLNVQIPPAVSTPTCKALNSLLASFRNSFLGTANPQSQRVT